MIGRVLGRLRLVELGLCIRGIGLGDIEGGLGLSRGGVLGLGVRLGGIGRLLGLLGLLLCLGARDIHGDAHGVGRSIGIGDRYGTGHSALTGGVGRLCP